MRFSVNWKSDDVILDRTRCTATSIKSRVSQGPPYQWAVGEAPLPMGPHGLRQFQVTVSHSKLGGRHKDWMWSYIEVGVVATSRSELEALDRNKPLKKRRIARSGSCCVGGTFPTAPVWNKDHAEQIHGWQCPSEGDTLGVVITRQAKMHAMLNGKTVGMLNISPASQAILNNDQLWPLVEFHFNNLSVRMSALSFAAIPSIHTSALLAQLCCSDSRPYRMSQCILLMTPEMLSNIYKLDPLETYAIVRGTCRECRDALPAGHETFASFLRDLRLIVHDTPSSRQKLEYHLRAGPARWGKYRGVHALAAHLQHIGNDLNMESGAGSDVPNLALLCQSIFWTYLSFTGVHYAWKVRRNAALILLDLAHMDEAGNEAGKIKQILQERHQEAQQIYASITDKRRARVMAMYSAVSEAPFSFKAVQCDAALTSGDHHWLQQEPPSVDEPRMFCLERAPNTPRPPSESSMSDEEYSVIDETDL